jgi:hypothetical protein
VKKWFSENKKKYLRNGKDFERVKKNVRMATWKE